MPSNTLSDARLDELLVEVQDEMESAVADAEYDQNPQLAIDAVGEFDLAEMRSILTELQSLRSQAGVSEPFAYTTKTSLEIMERSESRSGSFALFLPFEGMDEIKGVEFVPLYARPAPIEITEAMVERLAKFITEECYGYSWDGLRKDGRVTDGGFKPFSYNSFGGKAIQGTQNDLRDVARNAFAALQGEQK